MQVVHCLRGTPGGRMWICSFSEQHPSILGVTALHSSGLYKCDVAQRLPYEQLIIHLIVAHNSPYTCRAQQLNPFFPLMHPFLLILPVPLSNLFTINGSMLPKFKSPNNIQQETEHKLEGLGFINYLPVQRGNDIRSCQGALNE